jgi:hypothetical protein
MNYFMTANGKSVLAAFAIDRIDNQCFYIADLALSFADTSKILCQPCSSGYYFIHLVTDGNKHLIRGMEKLIDMQRNRGEIVLIRQQRILLVVLMSSVGPAIMFLQAAAIALSRYYEQMRAIREGFIGSYHPDEFFLEIVSFDVIAGLLFLLWIVLRVMHYRSLVGSVYRISQAGIQFLAPVSWSSYEPPFPTLIAWNEIKVLVRYEIHYPATSQATVPMFGIILWEYEAWFARQLQEQRPGFLRRLLLAFSSYYLLLASHCWYGPSSMPTRGNATTSHAANIGLHV